MNDDPSAGGVAGSDGKPHARDNSGLAVLAVDDEPPALAELVYLLEHDQGIARVTAAGTATDALDALQREEFDAVFLDIRMPGMTGLQIAGLIGRFGRPPAVVFVSAYDTHAADAFDIDAVDFVRKPVRPERLAQAVRRVAARRESTANAAAPAAAQPHQPAAAVEPVVAGAPTLPPPAAPTLPPTPDQVSPTAPTAPPADETLAVELVGVVRYVRRSQVVFAEARGDYVRLHTRDAAHLVRVSLSSLAERWAEVGFVRVHRQYVVNTTYVEQLRSTAGRLSIDLGADQSVPVSRRYTAAVKTALVAAHSLNRPPP